MAHSHTHNSSEQPKDNNARRLMFAFCITAGFMLVEVVGGILSGSLALLADAGHMLLLWSICRITSSNSACASYIINMWLIVLPEKLNPA